MSFVGAANRRSLRFGGQRQPASGRDDNHKIKAAEMRPEVTL
jgi:hypothetical protein